MKVYLYPDGAGTLHAIAEDGSRPAHSDLEPGKEVTDADICALRDLVRIVHPNARMLWVHDPAYHPAVRTLIAAELEPALEEEGTTKVGLHLCESCAHQPVCSGAAESARIGFTISTCESDVPVPRTKDHE